MEKKEEFHCSQCGKCCIKSSGTIMFEREDIERWRKEKRVDILEHPFVDLFTLDFLMPSELGLCTRKEVMKVLKNAEKKHGIKFVWGGYLNRCPFLKWIGKEKYKCLIYGTHPYMCRTYPYKENGTINRNISECPEVNLGQGLDESS